MIRCAGILSLGLHNYHRYVYGASVLPSHPSNWEVNTLIEDDSSFWQRLRNFIDTWALVYFWINQNLSMRDSVKKKLGNDIPYDFDLMKKTSILLINEHPLFVHTRPEQPNTIFFTGIHIEKTPPTLPKVRKSSSIKLYDYLTIKLYLGDMYLYCRELQLPDNRASLQLPLQLLPISLSDSKLNIRSMVLHRRRSSDDSWTTRRRDLST